jgi:hypothetical protein
LNTNNTDYQNRTRCEALGMLHIHIWSQKSSCFSGEKSYGLEEHS